MTPVGDDLVGVAVLSSRRRGYPEHLADFPALVARLQGPATTPVRGAGPLRQRVRARVAGRVLLVGDAAGYVDALTGEGVSLALLSAQALVGCLRAGTPKRTRVPGCGYRGVTGCSPGRSWGPAGTGRRRG
ncbi:hypothetical protein ACFQX6_20145 [Streptosporangium lutulentum]